MWLKNWLFPTFSKERLYSENKRATATSNVMKVSYIENYWKFVKEKAKILRKYKNDN